MKEILVSTEDLASRLGSPGLVVIDARPQMAYLFSHVPGAVNVAWRAFSDPDAATKGVLDPNVERLAQRVGALGVANVSDVVVYGDPMDGSGEEARIFWTLRFLGHEKVRVLNGGFHKWSAERRPIERGSSSPVAVRFSAKPNPKWLMLKDELKDRLKDSALGIADARSPQEYAGATGPGISRGGRIPGAKNLPFDRFYNADGTLQSAEKIEAAARAAGITKDQEVVTYCVGGVRSSMLFLVLLSAGYSNLRNYAGSWWEWSNDADLPVEQ